MTKLIPIPIPDIGSFDSVEVIEVMVKVGDSIKKEDSLIVVESEKASDGYSITLRRYCRRN